MGFELDRVVIENWCRESELARRVVRSLTPGVTVDYVEDARGALRPSADAVDAFGAGKRRMVLMRRRAPFLMGCPAGSQQFACCGYLVMVLGSNCPMDCSYCYLQEHLADNPTLQVYANYRDVFAELDRLNPAGRTLRIGTGEWADSLAFDSVTGISVELIEYFARRENLMLELKTKTVEIDNLLKVDPKDHTIVSWSLSPEAVYRSSEAGTAPPEGRMTAAAQVRAAGYRVAFHLDPMIAYERAEADYVGLLDRLFDRIDPAHISFVSMGGLRMTPGLRTAARRRFPRDPMLVGEEVLAADGRYRTFAPLRLGLYRKLRDRIVRARPDLPVYLCMENAGVHRRVFELAPPSPAGIGARLLGA